MLSGSILITGGAGTLGKQIIKRAFQEKWPCRITVMSTDATKHMQVKKMYPDVNFIVGDIRDATAVFNAVAGKDIVIHAAAVKHIPESEVNTLDTYEINVEGSQRILEACTYHGTPHVVGISTDKSCHPANAYGATKYLMEKVFQEYSRKGFDTRFHLVRYGNVLESTASVIEVWKQAIERGEKIKITNPDMTRFWISPNNAVDLILNALKLESGVILIPKMKSLSIGNLADYTLENYEWESVPIRPGEKMHETLLTVEECSYAHESDGYFFLVPTTSKQVEIPVNRPYSSDMAPKLTKDELNALLEG